MRNGLIGLAVAIAACGSSSGGSGGKGGSGGGAAGTGGSGSGGAGAADGGGSSDASGNRALGTLSKAEADQLCSDTGAYFARSITRAYSCRWAGLVYAQSSSAPTDADLQSNCSKTEGSCNQSDASTSGPGANTMCFGVPSTCTATVAQYFTCVADETTVFNQALKTLPSCATLTRADFDGIVAVQTGANQPASCTSVMNTCPDLFIPPPN